MATRLHAHPPTLRQRCNFTGNDRLPPAGNSGRPAPDDGGERAAAIRRQPRHFHPRCHACGVASGPQADGPQLRVDRRRGDRADPRAALPGAGRHAVPHRRDPGLSRYAAGGMGVGQRHPAGAVHRGGDRAVRPRHPRFVPGADPVDPGRGGAGLPAAARTRGAGQRARRAVAEREFRIRADLQFRVGEVVHRREHGRRARPLDVAAVRRQDRWPHRRVRAGESRADPGGDVLHAARLAHDLRAPGGPRAARLAWQDDDRSWPTSTACWRSSCADSCW